MTNAQWLKVTRERHARERMILNACFDLEAEGGSTASVRVAARLGGAVRETTVRTARRWFARIGAYPEASDPKALGRIHAAQVREACERVVARGGVPTSTAVAAESRLPTRICRKHLKILRRTTTLLDTFEPERDVDRRERQAIERRLASARRRKTKTKEKPNVVAEGK